MLRQSVLGKIQSKALNTAMANNICHSAELLIECDFIWREISVGDQIFVESNIYQDNCIMVKQDTPYLVLAKIDQAANPLLIVESEKPNQLIAIHPAMICSYESATTPVIYC